MSIRINYARRGFKTVDEYVTMYGGKTEDRDFTTETLTKAKIWCRDCQRLKSWDISHVKSLNLEEQPIECAQCAGTNIDVAYLTVGDIPRVYVDATHAKSHNVVLDKLKDDYDTGKIPECFHETIQLFFNQDFYGVGTNRSLAYRNPDDPMPGNIINPETGLARTWSEYPWLEVAVLNTENTTDPRLRISSLPKIPSIVPRDLFYTNTGLLKTDVNGSDIREYTIDEYLAYSGLTMSTHIQPIVESTQLPDMGAAPIKTPITTTEYTPVERKYGEVAKRASSTSPNPYLEETCVETVKFVIDKSSIWSWTNDLDASDRVAVIEQFGDTWSRYEQEIPNEDIILFEIQNEYTLPASTTAYLSTDNISTYSPSIQAAYSRADYYHIREKGTLTSTTTTYRNIQIADIDSYMDEVDAMTDPIYDAREGCDCINDDDSVLVNGAPTKGSSQYTTLTQGLTLPKVPFKVTTPIADDQTPEEKAVLATYPGIAITMNSSEEGTIFNGLTIPGVDPKMINRLEPMDGCAECVRVNNYIYSSLLNMIIQVDLDNPTYENSLFELEI